MPISTTKMDGIKRSHPDLVDEYTAYFTQDPNELRILASSTYPSVLNAVASSQYTPGDVLKKMVGEVIIQYPPSHLRAAFENSSMPVDTLKKYSQVREYQRHIAVNISTPKSILDEYMTDNFLLEYVLKNSIMTPEVLHTYAFHKSEAVQKSVIVHSNTSTDMLLEMIEKSKSSYVIESLNDNKTLDQRDDVIRIYDAIANHSSLEIRKSFARSCSWSHLIRLLAKDLSPKVLENLAYNPYTDSDMLDTLAQSKDLKTLCNVAKHSNTSIETLQMLAKKSSRQISKALLDNDVIICEISIISK